MLDNKATDVAVPAAPLVELGEELGGHPYRPSAQEPVDKADGYTEDTAALVKFGGKLGGDPYQGGLTMMMGQGRASWKIQEYKRRRR